ncbi:hypothetical protein Trydic_g20211 [Trypoxylus dichotomus]
MTTLYIMGIELTTNEDEIEQALVRKYEGKTAVVEVARAQAMGLIKQREMRIGWAECGIKERVCVDRCFKCPEHGHKNRECTATVDRSVDCLKCW